MFRIYLLTIFTFLSFSLTQAEEKIIYFHSDITILDDGGLDITETIKVNAEGNQIQRGIFRVLPTTYKAKFGLNFNVAYDFKEVLKDGNATSNHTEDSKNEIKLYIGSSSEYLEAGEYTYQIRYKTDNQLSFYEDFDELYWNVNGNYWEFGIDSLSALVHLPNGAHVVQYHAYTGAHGESESNYNAEIFDSTKVSFTSTQKLYAKEGMTIAVGISKGIVMEPNYLLKLMEDNLGYLIGALGLIILSIYFMFVWSGVGIDPPKGVIYPRFEAPKNLSPAAARFIYKMAYDKKAFTASVMDLAIRGHLKIDHKKGKSYSLQLLDKTSDSLSRSDSAILNKLFKGNLTNLKLSNSNHTQIQGAIDTLKSKLKAEVEQEHFKLNRGYLIMGIVLALPFILAMFFLSSEFIDVFSTAWLSMWSIGLVFLLRTTFSSFKSKQFAAGIGMSLFSLPFIGAWIFAFVAFGGFASLTGIVMLVLYIVLILIFNYLLKAPTTMGRRVMDEIEGFQMYLKTAELHRMEQAKTTEENIRLFEQFLPYAIALNCETEWTKKFESMVDEALNSGSYTPTWYGGNYGNFNSNTIGSSLASSLNSTITSSSRAPQSSSTGSFSGGGGGFSGGGGSSGGGGGGGGGGGW